MNLAIIPIVVIDSLGKGTVMQFKTIPLVQRQEIFLKLVNLQDSKGVRESKKVVIAEFQIDDMTLEKITEEGMDRNWPPLSDDEIESEEVLIENDETPEDEVKT